MRPTKRQLETVQERLGLLEVDSQLVVRVFESRAHSGELVLLIRDRLEIEAIRIGRGGLAIRAAYDDVHGAPPGGDFKEALG